MFNLFKKEEVKPTAEAYVPDNDRRIRELELKIDTLQSELDIKRANFQSELAIKDKEFKADKDRWEKDKESDLNRYKKELLLKSEQDVAKVRHEFESKLIEEKKRLNDELYITLTKELTKLHSEGNSQTQFVQDLALKMVSKVPQLESK